MPSGDAKDPVLDGASLENVRLLAAASAKETEHQ